jgi:hypothetical protein
LTPSFFHKVAVCTPAVLDYVITSRADDVLHSLMGLQFHSALGWERQVTKAGSMSMYYGRSQDVPDVWTPYAVLCIATLLFQLPIQEKKKPQNKK